MEDNKIGNVPALVVARWREQNIDAPTKRTDPWTSVETMFCATVPSGLVALYAMSDGMQEGRMDDMLLRFWSYSEIEQELVTQVAQNRMVVFADYSLFAHTYALQISPADAQSLRVVLTDGHVTVEVSRSFDEFLSLYIKKSPHLFRT